MRGGTKRALLLAGAVATSLVVTVTAFNPAPHSGGDNAGYLALAYDLAAHGSYTEVFDPERLPHTKYPPVFPALLALMMAAGARSWVSFKATAVVATVASTALTFLLAERRLGPLPAFGVAVLFATSAAVVYYSHWVLSDPLFVALTLAALVALDRVAQVQKESDDGRADDGRRGAVGWFAVAILAAGLASFTRSAGLPLVIALLVWLALRARWKALAATAVTIGLPWAWWWWRGRASPVASYAEEFWMVDPYDPSLGRVGVLGLIPRAVGNLTAYVSTHGPAGIVGPGVSGLGLLGVALLLTTLAGWGLVVLGSGGASWRSLRERVGPAELFLPLYAGLILLWPPVWAGDRFALPLYPLVFVYGGVALRAVGSRLPAIASTLVSAAAILALLLPAVAAWRAATEEARACAAVARRAGPFACYGPRVGAFAEAARWAGDGLPDGAAVLTRKPRHFFVLSGVPSRTFPFSEDPAAHLDLADRLGVRYVLLDQWDGLASRYVGSAVASRPDAFCYVRAFGDPSTGAAQLLGILPPALRPSPAPGRDPAAVGLGACPEQAYVRDPADAPQPSPSRSGRVPLLESLDS